MTSKTYIICIGGFTQGIGKRSGLFRLWMKLLKFRSENVSVELHKWDARFGDVAEQLFLASEDTEVSVIVFAYSYGGGFGFLQLARELGRRGLKIETAVLSDAIYRSKWLIGKWLAFAGWPLIRIPANVRHVHWFFQRMGRLRGHNVVAVNVQTTTVEEGIKLDASHVYLDDHPAFHKLAINVAESTLGQT